MTDEDLEKMKLNELTGPKSERHVNHWQQASHVKLPFPPATSITRRRFHSSEFSVEVTLISVSLADYRTFSLLLSGFMFLFSATQLLETRFVPHVAGMKMKI